MYWAYFDILPSMEFEGLHSTRRRQRTEDQEDRSSPFFVLRRNQRGTYRQLNIQQGANSCNGMEAGHP